MIAHVVKVSAKTFTIYLNARQSLTYRLELAQVFLPCLYLRFIESALSLHSFCHNRSCNLGIGFDLDAR